MINTTYRITNPSFRAANSNNQNIKPYSELTKTKQSLNNEADEYPSTPCEPYLKVLWTNFMRMFAPQNLKVFKPDRTEKCVETNAVTDKDALEKIYKFFEDYTSSKGNSAKITNFEMDTQEKILISYNDKGVDSWFVMNLGSPRRFDPAYISAHGRVTRKDLADEGYTEGNYSLTRTEICKSWDANKFEKFCNLVGLAKTVYHQKQITDIQQLYNSHSHKVFEEAMEGEAPIINNIIYSSAEEVFTPDPPGLPAIGIEGKDDFIEIESHPINELPENT